MKGILFFLYLAVSVCFLYAQTWQSAYDSSLVYQERLKYSQAAIWGEKALTLYQQQVPTKDTNYCVLLRNQVDNYYSLGKFKEALPYAQKDSVFVVNTMGKENGDYAMVCNQLGMLYNKLGLFLLTEKLYLETLHTQELLTGKEDPEYATICSNLGLLYQNMGKYNSAESFLKKSLEIQAKINKNSADYSISCNNLGALYWEIGKYDLAKSLLVEAKDIRYKVLGVKHPQYLTSCGNVAVLYQEMGYYAKTESLLKTTLTTIEEVLGKQHPQYANTLNTLSRLYLTIGKIGSAIRLTTEAATVAKEGKHSMLYAECINNLALLYDNLGNYVQAESLYKESLAIRIKLYGSQHVNYALTCSNLALVYVKTQQYALAESLYITAKNIRAKNFGITHPDYAYSCNNLANLYIKTQKYTFAESLFKHAIQVFSQNFGNNHITTLTARKSLTFLYYKMGKYELTQTQYKSLIQEIYTIVGNHHSLYIQTCNDLACLYQDTHQFDKAESLFKQVVFLKTAEIQQNFLSLTESEKENYIKANQGYFTFFYHFVLSQNRGIENAYNLSLLTKGMILNNLQSIRNHILSSSDTTLKNTYLSWQNLSKKLSKALETPLAERKTKGINVDSLQKLFQMLEQRLTFSVELKPLFETQKITYKNIQNKLSKQEAAIEMVRVDHNDTITYAALITTHNQTPKMVVLASSGILLETNYLQNYRRSIKNKLEDTESYVAYWKPIAEYLAKNKIKKVYFSPDGVYNQVNLNTLYNPATHNYVLDEVEVINVTNTKDIVITKSSAQIKNAFLVGRPDYKAKTKLQNTERSETLSDLQGTELEVNNIDQTAKKVNLSTQKITAQAATKDTILHQISPSILHIATHGFFKPNTELVSQRMLQSGLILAGAEVLNAFEAMQMDLRGTELVCLSACETGLGEVKAGEGVYGLQRAFKVAGAKAVIMSLWKVNDEATQELMSNFYTNWLEKKQPKRTAFNNAQNTLRKKYANPYYWGAFVMVGE